ncbi:hypothetical protein HWQ46_02605 [Shewanella sp. D64]|uniref:hypothetical protein n=1 Tax=unclassified Shewanella TaxID=196818 RepID=UPI0022BA248F|nr:MULTISPECIES: hypothetical protein [unclassified Shewanella]MEC4724437.1 hypothetical protein [Shewanella sp. D64]MEC4736786.1 hypothetical protein [Shewanella sp. E94]WBJ94551.1 hypothetical protein HWQ47_22245 [Shewanella sp. MTB7]
MKTTTNKDKASIANQTLAESGSVQNNRITLIEDALLESVSGGNAVDGGICIGHQFCEVPPHNDRG